MELIELENRREPIFSPVMNDGRVDRVSSHVFTSKHLTIDTHYSS